MTSICLNMIVKNEAHVIRRCLASLKPWIDAWVIVDTGSTDGTQELVREALAGVPGELFERPWKDFGFNRTEAIELAGRRSDYLLFIDADEEWRVPEGFRWPDLQADAYHVLHRYGGMEYQRPCLAATRLPWRFEGVLHEFLHCPGAHDTVILPGPWIQVHPEGARSADPEKFNRDAAILEEALQTEPHNARYAFYLAQSYRDAGQVERSLELYQRRASMGGWEEEVWYSLLQIALLKERLGQDPGEVQAAFLKASEARPGRPETLGQLARFCRLGGQFHLAYLFADRAKELPPTEDLLYVDPSFPAWRNWDEFAVACYWTGRYKESEAACLRLLKGGLLPDTERPRVEANLGFARTALGQDAAIAQMLKARPRLNLGCGRFPDPEAINVDLAPLPGVDLVVDLDALGEGGLPLPGDSIEAFTLSHVLEHIHNVLPLMQELHRVAKPGAILTVRLPHGATDDAWEDPTRVRPFFPQSFGYYSQPFYWRADYGYRGDWQPQEIILLVSEQACQNLSDAEILARAGRERNWILEMVATLQAIKPIRPPLQNLQVPPQMRIRRV
jgi:glycosyltransferase involved in cell wall biosynthesis